MNKKGETFPDEVLLSEMNIRVTVGEFHQTHDEARIAVELIGNGVLGLSTPELREVLLKLLAGQRLTEAETGQDFHYARSYINEIEHVRAELSRRGELEN